MIDKANTVKVGLITKSHGVDGELVVRAHTGFTSDDLTYEFLFVELDGGLVPYYVEEVRLKNGEEALVKFEYVDTQDEARRLSGAEVFFSREWLDVSEGDFSIGSVIGFEARDAKVGVLGTIDDIDDSNNANMLFVINHGGDELLVPVADDFIKSIDTDNKVIYFELPEGLLDL